MSVRKLLERLEVLQNALISTAQEPDEVLRTKIAYEALAECDEEGEREELDPNLPIAIPSLPGKGGFRPNSSIKQNKIK